MSTDQFPLPGPVDPAAGSGATWIADQIVAKIAANAAREVEGVEALRGSRIRRGWVRSSDRRAGAAGVKITDGRAAIDLRLVVRDGLAIPAIVDEVRARVSERGEFGTGLTVSKVDIGVVDVVGPADPAAEEPAPEPPEATEEAGAPEDEVPASPS